MAASPRPVLRLLLMSYTRLPQAARPHCLPPGRLPLPAAALAPGSLGAVALAWALMPSSTMDPARPPPQPDPQFVLRGTQSAVHALHFCSEARNQDRPLLLSGSLSGLVHIWSLQTRRTLATLDGHGGQCVTWLQTLPHGPHLLSQGRDLRLCLWDLAEGRNAVVDSVRLESVGFCRSCMLAMAQPRWMLAMPGRDNSEVEILEMPSKTSVCALKPGAGAKPGMPMCLKLWQAASSPRPHLLAGYEDGSVVLWDVSERKVCSRVACHTEPALALDFDSQKARGVSGSAEKALAVWSLDEQQALKVCRTQELTNPGVADVTLRLDRKLLATAGWDHRVRLFHWRTMKPLAVLDFHTASVHCVAFANDGLLAAGSGDQRISVWSLYPST
ncbi:PREDICTED: guanine nucleotide-binding protein subunit beta-like protein 1 [Elephantulus edwardii]|uniref:guanine nucleotide-binding protein subunit beta-like protein 1 n=1 Tax=Elephantulus edwardii TaxID=28737 RepID=UPI0003F06797|nr:PREDICTED: guanine nucleotide-binding protein subunit beta-like protein 1 [Elephantulus edwardii]